MTHYTCDRCGQSVHRPDLRSGSVEHLTDSRLHFELCHNCFVVLRRFLHGDAVAAVDSLQDATTPNPAQDVSGIETGGFSQW